MKLYKVLLVILSLLDDCSLTIAQHQGVGLRGNNDVYYFIDKVVVDEHDANSIINNNNNEEAQQQLVVVDKSSNTIPDSTTSRRLIQDEHQENDDNKHPQYAFAHRLNDEDYIQSALDGGITGIECDVIWSTWRNSWVVQHDTPNLSWAGPRLEVWLEKLKTLLNNNNSNGDNYETATFSALWLDIKSPNDDSLYNVMKMVHDIFDDTTTNNNDYNFAVIYDLNDKENVLESSSSSGRGYTAIKDSLRDNEGIGLWLKNGEEDSIPALMKKFEQDNIPRTTVSHGHSLDIDEETLFGINRMNDPTNPYCFKKVFTWTMSYQSTMEDHMNPQNGHRTDGQIIGNPFSEWKPNLALVDDIILNFERAVEEFSSTQRTARPSDPFWNISVQQPSFFQPQQQTTTTMMMMSYNIQIQTGDRWRAGTDSNIYLTLHHGDDDDDDNNGRSISTTTETRLNGYLSGNAFERGDLDQLELILSGNNRDVGRL